MGPRGHPNYIAFWLHRLSGIGLALFLPFHFWALASVIRGRAALDGFLAWTEHPLVKLAEAGLVLLLAIHLGGGLRILALEFLGWRRIQATLVATSVGASFVLGIGFLMNAL